MRAAIDHEDADWAGHPGGYVCLHCQAFVSDGEWAAFLHPVAAPEPEPKPHPRPRAKRAHAKKA